MLPLQPLMSMDDTRTRLTIDRLYQHSSPIELSRIAQYIQRPLNPKGPTLLPHWFARMNRPYMFRLFQYFGTKYLKEGVMLQFFIISGHSTFPIFQLSLFHLPISHSFIADILSIAYSSSSYDYSSTLLSYSSMAYSSFVSLDDILLCLLIHF